MTGVKISIKEMVKTSRMFGESPQSCKISKIQKQDQRNRNNPKKKLAFLLTFIGLVNTMNDCKINPPYNSTSTNF